MFRLLNVLFLLSINSPVQARVLASYADIVAIASKGVVNIRTTTRVPRHSAKDDPYQFFLNEKIPKIADSQSLGSGVIVDRRGYILTSYHVIEQATKIQVLFHNKHKASAVVVGTDPKTDIALLKVKLPKGVKELDLADSSKARPGDVVLAIGNPFGYAHTVTSGIISAVGRVIGTGPYDQFIQTDAPIHPGNSGGPLIDNRGRVVGINTAVAANSYGIGFAVPSNLAKKVTKDLTKHGKVIRPWLGIVGQNILSAEDIGMNFDPTGVYGVIVSNLIVNSPAQNSGIKMGDLIMEVDSKKVADANFLQRHLGEQKPGEKVKLKIYRRSEGHKTLTVTLGSTPKSSELPPERDLF